MGEISGKFRIIAQCWILVPRISGALGGSRLYSQFAASPNPFPATFPPHPPGFSIGICLGPSASNPVRGTSLSTLRPGGPGDSRRGGRRSLAMRTRSVSTKTSRNHFPTYFSHLWTSPVNDILLLLHMLHKRSTKKSVTVPTHLMMGP